jgi:replicative DNA helicase
VAEQRDNNQGAASAIERAIRDGHAQGVARQTLEASIQASSSIDDVEKQRLRRLVAELHGDPPVRPLRAAASSSRARGKQHAPAAQNGAVPPQNLEAEENILGAIMVSPGALQACREIVSADGREFYRESHARVWRAALAREDAEPGSVNAITLVDELEKRGDLEHAGGRVRLHELAALVPATANAPHYARIVVELHALRDLIRVGGEISKLGWERPTDTPALIVRAQELLDPVTIHRTLAAAPTEAVGGGAFIFDNPDDLAAGTVWGHELQLGWASGEGLMLVGPDGVGKTTVGQQLALARCGLRTHVLGMPVQPDTRRVLYIAADRPKQARRSLARMVAEHNRDDLDERLTVWRGPLPAMLNEDRTVLTRLAKQLDAGTVVIDSLKDVAFDLAKDDAGGRIASAFQHLIASEVELLVLHHPRKPESGNPKPNKIGDVYGSRLIFGVMGSVLLLWGEAGDVIVELRHLKPPVEEIGPWNLQHDHANGITTVAKQPDLVEIAWQAGGEGFSATDAAARARAAERDAEPKRG